MISLRLPRLEDAASGYEGMRPLCSRRIFPKLDGVGNPLTHVLDRPAPRRESVFPWTDPVPVDAHRYGLEVPRDDRVSRPRGVTGGIGPITHGSAYHTDVMKSEALKQALDLHGFDVAFGGARRDEEKSRAKERICSFRAPGRRWEAKAQRPELWNLYNTRVNPGETIM